MTTDIVFILISCSNIFFPLSSFFFFLSKIFRLNLSTSCFSTFLEHQTNEPVRFLELLSVRSSSSGAMSMSWLCFITFGNPACTTRPALCLFFVHLKRKDSALLVTLKLYIYRCFFLPCFVDPRNWCSTTSEMLRRFHKKVAIFRTVIRLRISMHLWKIWKCKNVQSTGNIQRHKIFEMWYSL